VFSWFTFHSENYDFDGILNGLYKTVSKVRISPEAGL
jgi:hypothetical protein